MTDLPEPAAPAEPQEWYCDQCGARYPSAGLCDNQHPPAELKPLDAVAQADDGSQAQTEPESPAEDAGEPAGDTPEAAATVVAPEVAAAAQPSAGTSTLQDAKAALEAAYGALKTAIDNLNEHLTQQG